VKEYIDDSLDQSLPPPAELGMQEVYRFPNNSSDLKPSTLAEIQEISHKKIRSHAIPTASVSPALPENLRYK